MKYFYWLILIFLIKFSPTHAAARPLDVIVTSFAPPFVIQAGNNQFFGFDISMMEYICQKMQRTCHYRAVPFPVLLKSIQTNEADIAIGAITITLDRAKNIIFSNPYLPSQSSFLTVATNPSDIISNEKLPKQKIGIAEGTIFFEQLKKLGVLDENIIQFPNTEGVLSALQTGEITLALIDTPTAHYWQAQSTNTLKVLGKPLVFGYGFGIAINANEIELLADINKALSIYHADRAFEVDYQKYLASF